MQLPESHQIPSLALSWATGVKGLATIGAVGVLCHRLHFIHGEHHLQAPVFLGVWLFVSLSLWSAVYLAQLYGLVPDLTSPVGAVALLESAFFVPLFGSIFVYRVFQHPLRDFNGPRLAAVSKIWHLWHMCFTPNHLFVEQLHNEYGKIIRTGPQELTIIDPDVWQVIDGPGTTCIKAPWYDMLHPMVALNSIRTRQAYMRRRKRWDDVLKITSTNLAEKEERIHHHAMALLRELYQSARKPVNVTNWFYYFSFDFMGEILFGRTFSLVENLNTAAEPHFAPDLMSQGMGMLRYFTPTPWLGHICLQLAPYFPIVTQKWNRAVRWAAEVSDEQLQVSKGMRQEDEEANRLSQAAAFSIFLNSARQSDDAESLDRLALYGDVFAFSVAGSHTVATALTTLCYELANRPALQEEVRREVAAAGLGKTHEAGRGFKEIKNTTVLAELPLLNAVITEVLRLYPQLPTAGIRQTVDKGVVIAGKFIPPQTVIVAPRWTIARLESAFEKPNEFIPERWTTKPEMVKNRQGLNGFGIGRHSCPGKALGQMELRMVTALLVANFELTFAPTETKKSRVIDELQDAFTARAGDLELVFTPLVDFA